MPLLISQCKRRDKSCESEVDARMPRKCVDSISDAV